MKSKFIRVSNFNFYTVKTLDVKIGFDRMVMIFDREQFREAHIKLRNEQ
jgi:hypothetical protein